MPVQERIGNTLVPTVSTLNKYGMDRADFEQMLADQGGVCGVCEKDPSSGRLYIDHEHVRGWKDMDPEERRRYVRGLCCYVCNRFILNARITAAVLRLAADYLDRYEERKEKWPGK